MQRSQRFTRDPHAHVIHVPGKRLLQSLAPSFVRARVSGHHRRSVNATLSMVSFLDVLVVTVLFLLTSFSASAECPQRMVDIPSAVHATDLVDAPLVTVTRNAILVDGVAAGSARAIEETGRTQKLDELGHILEQKRALWRAVQPNRPFPGECILQIDRDVPSIIVKSAFQTAVSAGYPRVSFMVKKLAD